MIARLEPDHANKRFDIRSRHRRRLQPSWQAASEGHRAGQLTLVYELDGKTYRTPIKTLRGDYRAARWHHRQSACADGNAIDFKPATDDIFQERLYAIQWITQRR